MVLLTATAVAASERRRERERETEKGIHSKTRYGVIRQRHRERIKIYKKRIMIKKNETITKQ